jgi:hypothetical protein
MSSGEPERLRAGRAFGELVERFYVYESAFASERRLVPLKGRGARADLFAWVAPEHREAVVLEAKDTNWDALAARGTVRRNLHRHAAQVWRYLNADVHLDAKVEVALRHCEVQGALVYSRQPRSHGLRELIETELAAERLSVVWFDEAPPRESPAWGAWAAMGVGSLPSLAELRRQEQLEPEPATRPRPSASSFGSGNGRSCRRGCRYAACDPFATYTTGTSRESHPRLCLVLSRGVGGASS